MFISTVYCQLCSTLLEGLQNDLFVFCDTVWRNIIAPSKVVSKTSKRQLEGNRPTTMGVTGGIENQILYLKEA